MTIPPPPFQQSTGLPSAASLLSRPARYQGHSVASPIPLLVALCAFAAGSLCLLLGDSIAVGIIGYFTSGFVTILCFGWDSVAQRKGLVNPNFQNKPRYRTLLRWIVVVGFIVATVNLITVAMPIAEALSNLGGTQ